MSAHPEPLRKDRKIINRKNTRDGKIICMIDNCPVVSLSDLEYHHIHPYLFEEKLDNNNIATICKKHHREIGHLSIAEYKVLKAMEAFFSDGSLKKLDDVLLTVLNDLEKGRPFNFSLEDGGNSITVNLETGLNNSLPSEVKSPEHNAASFESEVKIPGNDNEFATRQTVIPVANVKSKSTLYTLPLSVCPSTGFKYFYIVLPVEFLNNDIELQPRPLEFKRLWDLYRHLLVNSQLTPSICRLSQNRILLFDGQHKAAAQIWAGRKNIECKVYIDPSVKVLKETNLVAHDKLRQMPFFTSVLINKWASIFTEEWKDYMEQKGDKSEAGFVSFLVSRGKKKPEAIHMLESNIYDSILEDSQNHLKKYIEEYSGVEKKPITVNRLRQTLLKRFIVNPPLAIELDESDKLREFERKNVIRLLNLISDYTLQGIWNLGDSSREQKIAEKIYLNGSFKAWIAILKDVISNILELYDENDRREIFLREIRDEQWELIEKSISILFGFRIWSDDSQENYNNLRVNNENVVRKYLSRKGLSANWILNSQYDEENNFID
jgi:hypothetical protein